MNLERVQKYYELIDRELGIESNEFDSFDYDDELDLFGFESDEDDLFGFNDDYDLFGFESDYDDLFGFNDDYDLFGFESDYDEYDEFGYESSGMSGAYIARMTGQPWIRMLIDPRGKRAILNSIKKFENKLYEFTQVARTIGNYQEFSMNFVSKLNPDALKGLYIASWFWIYQNATKRLMMPSLVKIMRAMKSAERGIEYFSISHLKEALPKLKHGFAQMKINENGNNKEMVNDMMFKLIVNQLFANDKHYFSKMMSMILSTLSWLVSTFFRKKHKDFYEAGREINTLDNNKDAARTNTRASIDANITSSEKEKIVKLICEICELVRVLILAVNPKTTARITLAINQHIASRRPNK